MAPPTDNTRSVIRRLTAATVGGTVKWDPVSDNAFSVERPSGIVRVYSADDDGLHPFVFEIRNPQGQTVVSADTMVGERYAPWEVEIADLFLAARDSALGVTTAMRDLERDLGLDHVADPGADIPF